MECRAKVNFKSEGNAERLICAFFQEFKSGNDIEINGNEANVQLFFDEPPMQIIEAICACKVIEFQCAKKLGGHREDEPEQKEVEEEISEQSKQEEAEEEIPEQSKQEEVEEEIPEKTEQAEAEEEIPEQPEKEEAEKEIPEQPEQTVTQEEIIQSTEPPKKKRGRPATPKAATTIAVESVNIPELKEIAKKATSFDDFAKLVAEWLEMGKKQEFFENLAIASTEVGKLSWKELEEVLNNKKILYSNWDKIWISNQVSKKLKEYSVTILPFLNAIGQYKDYSFVHEQSEETSTEQTTEETVTTVEEETSGEVEESTPKNRVKMECIPEIPHFEETLANVDKTQPIEDRVRYVLTAMGLNKLNANKQGKILKIANTAVRLRTITINNILSKANIPEKSSLHDELVFSEFINSFVKENNYDEKVKVVDFLIELQKVIMIESEIGL